MLVLACSRKCSYETASVVVTNKSLVIYFIIQSFFVLSFIKGHAYPSTHWPDTCETPWSCYQDNAGQRHSHLLAIYSVQWWETSSPQQKDKSKEPNLFAVLSAEQDIKREADWLSKTGWYEYFARLIRLDEHLNSDTMSSQQNTNRIKWWINIWIWKKKFLDWLAPGLLTYSLCFLAMLTVGKNFQNYLKNLLATRPLTCLWHVK